MGITKQNQIEEAYRNDKAEERLSESIARDDDVGFKDGPACIETLNKKFRDGEKDQ